MPDEMPCQNHLLRVESRCMDFFLKCNECRLPEYTEFCFPKWPEFSFPKSTEFCFPEWLDSSFLEVAERDMETADLDLDRSVPLLRLQVMQAEGLVSHHGPAIKKNRSLMRSVRFWICFLLMLGVPSINFGFGWAA